MEPEHVRALLSYLDFVAAQLRMLGELGVADPDAPPDALAQMRQDVLRTADAALFLVRARLPRTEKISLSDGGEGIFLPPDSALPARR